MFNTCVKHFWFYITRLYWHCERFWWLWCQKWIFWCFTFLVSHMSKRVINYCKHYGVVMLTFPQFESVHLFSSCHWAPNQIVDAMLFSICYIIIDPYKRPKGVCVHTKPNPLQTFKSHCLRANIWSSMRDCEEGGRFEKRPKVLQTSPF